MSPLYSISYIRNPAGGALDCTPLAKYTTDRAPPRESTLHTYTYLSVEGDPPPPGPYSVQ